jgi:hypothetical protein
MNLDLSPERLKSVTPAAAMALSRMSKRVDAIRGSRVLSPSDLPDITGSSQPASPSGDGRASPSPTCQPGMASAPAAVSTPTAGGTSAASRYLWPSRVSGDGGVTLRGRLASSRGAPHRIAVAEEVAEAAVRVAKRCHVCARASHTCVVMCVCAFVVCMGGVAAACAARCRQRGDATDPAADERRATSAGDRCIGV